MSIWSKVSANTGHLLNAIVLTSLSIHLLSARRDAASERVQFTARISILESLCERLKGGESVSDAEFEKLVALSRKLQGRHGIDNLENLQHGKGTSVSLKEALLGRDSENSIQ